jgi:Pterin-4a-carbinolamine dehydratase
MTRLDDAARTAFLAAHDGWRLEGEAISKTFHFPDFGSAMGFVTRVALAAEAADHHPDILVRWNRVTLTLTTHFVGALTARDTALATICDGFVADA